MPWARQALPPHPSILPQEYAYRTISLSFEDESLPGVLSSVIMSEDRLLRLYESDLPGWAVLLPRLGVYYRPWVRRLTWILFYAFSIVSLAAGFYDLYRNLPGVQASLGSWVEGRGRESTRMGMATLRCRRLHTHAPSHQALFNMAVARFWGPSVLLQWLEAHAQVGEGS